MKTISPTHQQDENRKRPDNPDERVADEPDACERLAEHERAKEELQGGGDVLEDAERGE